MSKGVKLPKIIGAQYVAPEDWINVVKTNSYCVYLSGHQGIGHYNVRFPREMYVK